MNRSVGGGCHQMHKQGKLWGVWLAPAIGGLVVVVSVYSAASRSPSDARKELSIRLEELRSEVAEAGLLAEHGARGDLTHHFVREHARQLGRHMQDSLDELRASAGKAGQQAVTEQASALGDTALTSLQRLADDAASAPAMQDVAARMTITARELSRLDRTLQQHDR
jgi:hypothetical protein